MVTISAIDFPSRRAVEVPWTRPGPLPEAAWVCGQCWEADLAHEDLVLAYSGFGRQHAAQAAVRHAERRCPQRLAVHGLRPCPYCGGWGATDGVDGYPVRCGSCHGQGTQPLHW